MDEMKDTIVRNRLEFPYDYSRKSCNLCFTSDWTITVSLLYHLALIYITHGLLSLPFDQAGSSSTVSSTR